MMFQTLPSDRAVGLGVVTVVGIAVLTAGLYNISHKIPTKEEVKKPIEKKDDELNTKSHEVQQDLSEHACAEHFGSCHCRSVRFKVRATRIINAVDTSSKIKFPRFTMRCSDFELLCDDRTLSMYTVKYGDGLLGIHSFCSICGVQVLYSPTIEPFEIQVNVDCLDRRNIDKIQYTRHCTGETESLAKNHELSHIFNRRGYVSSEQQHHLQFAPPLGQHHLFPRAADSGSETRHRPAPPSYYSEPLLREASDPVYAGYMNSCNLSSGGLSDVDEYSYGQHSNYYDARHDKTSFDESASGGHHERRSYSYEERLSIGSGAFSALSSTTVSPMNGSNSTNNSNSRQSDAFVSPNRYTQHHQPHQRESFPSLTVPSFNNAQSPYSTEYNAADDLTDHSHTSSESSANYRRGIVPPAAVVVEEVVRLERIVEPATPNHLLRQLKKHLTKYDESSVGSHTHSVGV